MVVVLLVALLVGLGVAYLGERVEMRWLLAVGAIVALAAVFGLEGPIEEALEDEPTTQRTPEQAFKEGCERLRHEKKVPKGYGRREQQICAYLEEH
jgi:hypothetical protein